MLEVKGLSKAYAGVPALENVSFSVQRGEIVALLGANGSGKTTTINSICRLLEWDSGDIEFDGQSILKSPQYLANIGAVLGSCRNVNYRLTASQNADYFARLRGCSGSAVKARIAALENQLGLAPHRRKEVMKLSTGNKQKAAMLSALSYQPDLLLLDEPTLGLDFQTIEELRNIILTSATENKQGFVITSHDMGFIDQLCTRVVVLDQGRCLFDGDIDTLKQRLFQYSLRVSRPEGIEEKKLESLWVGRHKVSLTDSHIEVQFERPQQCLATLQYLHALNADPDELVVQPLSMEQAYQSLVQQEVVCR